MKNILKSRKNKRWMKDGAITIIVSIAAGLSLVLFPQLSPATKVKQPAASNVGSSSQNIIGKAIVLDGDALKIDGISIRLHGIDAPETRQNCWKNDKEYPCGRASTIFLKRLINGQTVTCEIMDTDAYGRKVGKCSIAGNIDINAEMVLSGNAIAYLYFSYDYADQQAQAKIQKRGIWAGRFMEPYLFRRL